MENDSLVLNIENLHKYYGNKHVLKGVNLRVLKGCVAALIGPNGAGKTTLIKSVLNLLPITEGQITIDGTSHENFLARQKLAYLPEKFFFYPYYTVEATLDFYGSMYGLDESNRKRKTSELLELFSIADLQKNKIAEISKGQLQKVGMSCVFMSDANLFILDEPFSGLDPIGIKEVKDIFKKTSKLNKTILINSHILSEVEQFADFAAIINKGHILKEGTIDALKENKESLEDAFYQAIKDSQ